MALSDVELLSRLVGFDSVSRRSNLPVVDFLGELSDGDDARVERVASPDGAKANLVVRFGPEPDGTRSGLVLSGHMDTVPADEPEWQGDPFVLRDAGERLHGRGTCDMKGFLAVAWNVAHEARDLAAPLVLVYTYDEEVGTIGARRLVADWPGTASLPRHAIIGEPTSLRVVRMHKGHLRIRIGLRGVGAHSGYPHLGRNAIEAAARVLVSLRKLRHRLEGAGGPHTEFFPEVPFVPLNVGTIHGGAAVNVVPDRCTIEVGVRPLPGMDDQALFEAVRAAAVHAAGGDLAEVTMVAESPAMWLDPASRLHSELCGMTGQESGESASYATDAGWLSRADIECAVFGPGSIDVAHKPNEFVPRAELVAARRHLERAVDVFCR